MSINLSEVIWTMIGFFVLLLALKKLLFDPLLRHMDQRSARYAAAQEEIRRAQQERETAQQQAEEAERRCLDEGAAALAERRAQSARERSEALQEAHRQAAAALTEARKQAAQEAEAPPSGGETDQQARALADRLLP